MDDSEFVPGSLVRVKLKNILTFDSVEFRPSPNLNVVIGPNGTGKSTIFCAISLGLGAKPNILGRANMSGDFVKYNCTHGVIELELFHRPHNYVIVRTIDKRTNKSEWKIDKRMCNQKAVDELVTKLNIHMNNLCQFLPQERVADFARMSQQELLENTEIATGETELHEDHLKLKEARMRARTHETDLSNLKERLEQEIQKNLRLETDVNNLREREVHLEKIKILKMKRPWVEYQAKRIQHAKAKEELEEIKEHCKEARRRYAPLEQKLVEADQRKTQLDVRIKDRFAVIKENAKSIKKFSEDIEERSDKSAEEVSNLKGKEEEEEKRWRKIADLKRQISAMETELQQLDKNENLEPEITKNNQEIAQCNRKITQLQQSASATQRDIDETRRQMRDLQEELDRIFDIGKRRLEILKQRHHHTYEAVLWLRKNLHMFKKPVHEPMILCLHVKNKEDSRVIENHIAFNDLRAFVFEDAEDMNLFLLNVRDQQHLKVNAVRIPPQDLNFFQPRFPIEYLSHYGFYKYLLELIDCPDAVKRYLCSQYSLYQIPLGTAKTKDLANKIITDKELSLRQFYTPDTQYSVRVSRYDGETSTKNTFLKNSTILAVSVDTERETRIRQKLQAVTRECHKKEQILKKDYSEIQHLDVEMNKLREQKKQLAKRKSQESSLAVQIKSKVASLNNLERSAINVEAERARCLQNLHDIALEKARLLSQQRDLTERCCSLMMGKIRLCLEQGKAVREYTILNTSIQEEKQALQQTESRLEEAKNHLNEIKDQAKRLLEDAKRSTGLDANGSLPPHIKEEFERYPNTLSEIDAEIRDLTIRAECTSHADRGILEEYETRKRTIQRLGEELDVSQRVSSEHHQQIVERKTRWLRRIKDLIDRINKNFSFFFSTMKCAGEVDLNVPDNPEDYEKYGVRIRVKFRDSEPLRELTAHHQSGGERSVATVLFMLSLQELARCPLRMVDEINQGMDPINERKVFELMMQTICRKSSSQYFMLTPKLLKDLTYADNMNVMCIFNGQEMTLEYWNIRRFLKRRKRIGLAEEDS